MARIDSLLQLMLDESANELRLGTDREPELYRFGVRRRLSIPTMNEELLRHLLGELYDDARALALQAAGRIETTHEVPKLGVFQVTFTRRGAASPDGRGFDVTFMKSSPPAALPPLPEAAPPPAPKMVAPPTVATPAPVIAAEPAIVDDEALTRLLGLAVAERATDVHLCDGEAPVIRRDGRLHATGEPETASVLALFGERLGADARAEILAGRAHDRGFEIPELGRFRVNVYRTQDRVAAAVRLLPKRAPHLIDLGLPVPLDDLVTLPHGLVIVCGPTGSGKSSTLAALAQEALRKRGPMLLTLEDPIEHHLVAEGGRGIVRQRAIGHDAATFATGLRDALREDPDVLLVGEMRDPESIALALTAAETGHLVLTTMHARSTAAAVERIVDGSPLERQNHLRSQLAESLRVIVAQRLVPRARGGGRVVALEVLRVTHAVAALLREGRTAQIATALQSGKEARMIPLERSLADLVRAGEIRVEDARAVANDPTALTAYLS